MPSLGKLRRVDLREVWEDEASKFTPWLAEEDSLVELGETIGIDLELEATEKNVGPFSADILCKDTATGNWVLIENQLERTDHKHVGQLLTYAAGLNAVTIVWIAATFTDQHRAVLDWLNDITDDHFRFFGLEIEAWRIGESLPAPKFNVVAKPNAWTRSISEASRRISSDALTETKKFQLEYWTAFRSWIEKNSTTIKPTKPLTESWMTFAIGRADFQLLTTVSTRYNRIAAYLQVGGVDAKPHFYLLRQQKQEIEHALGEAVDWRELPGKGQSHAYFANENVDLTDRSQWPTQHAWLLEKLEKLDLAFRPFVKTLKAEDWESNSNDGDDELIPGEVIAHWLFKHTKIQFYTSIIGAHL